MTSSNSLPVEVWHQIFTYLPSKDLCSVNQVCRNWKSISDDPTLWQILRFTTVIKDDYANTAEALRQCLEYRLSEYTRSFTFEVKKNGTMTYSEWTCRTMCVCHFNRVFTPANSKLLGQIGTNIERIEIKCDKMGCYNNLYFIYWFRIAPNNNVKQVTLENCSLHFDLIPPLDQCEDPFPRFESLVLVNTRISDDSRANTACLNLIETFTKLSFTTTPDFERYNCMRSLKRALEASWIKFCGVRELDLSGSSITDERDVIKILLAFPGLVKLTFNNCTGLPEDLFTSRVGLRNYLNELQVIEAQNTSLTPDRILPEWRERGVVFIAN